MKRFLRKRKEYLLFEVLRDIEFIETFKQDALYCDEQDYRQKLITESQKPEEEQDQAEIKRLSNAISMSKAVKSEYEKLTEMADDIPKYLTLI